MPLLKRERALSERGCELFNVCYGNEVEIKPSRRVSCIPKINFHNIFHKLMTSEFDLKLSEHEIKMKKATEKMFRTTFLTPVLRNIYSPLTSCHLFRASPRTPRI